MNVGLLHAVLLLAAPTVIHDYDFHGVRLDCSMTRIEHESCGGGLYLPGPQPVTDCSHYTEPNIKKNYSLKIQFDGRLATFCQVGDPKCWTGSISSVSHDNRLMRISIVDVELTGNSKKMSYRRLANDLLPDAAGSIETVGTCLTRSGGRSIDQMLGEMP